MNSSQLRAGVATGYGLQDQDSEIRSWAGTRNSYLRQCVQSPPSFLSIGYRGLLRGVKRSGHEADNSPPSSAKIQECMALFLQLNTSSCHDAQL